MTAPNGRYFPIEPNKPPKQLPPDLRNPFLFLEPNSRLRNSAAHWTTYTYYTQDRSTIWELVIMDDGTARLFKMGHN